MIRARSSPRPLALWKQIQDAKEPAAQKPRRFIRRESPKRAALMRRYRARVKVWIKGKFCGVCKISKATQVHHLKPRSVRPDLILEVGNFLALCLPCHERIHSNPKWAYEKGFLKRSFDQK